LGVPVIKRGGVYIFIAVGSSSYQEGRGLYMYCHWEFQLSRGEGFIYVLPLGVPVIKRGGVYICIALGVPVIKRGGVYICITVGSSSYQEGRVEIPLTCLTQPHFCVCPKLKPGPGFPTSYVVIFFVFNCLSRDVIVCFVDIGGIVDQYCLKFLFIMQKK
jgi:hypothetical protein